MKVIGKRQRERGASAIELVLYTPLLFLMIFLIVQFGLTWHGNQIASAVAREAARVARADGGNTAAGQQHGESYAAQIGGNGLHDVTVTVVPVGAHEIRATVTGRGIEIVDGFAPQVSQTVQGPIEEFRPDQ